VSNGVIDPDKDTRLAADGLRLGTMTGDSVSVGETLGLDDVIASV